MSDETPSQKASRVAGKMKETMRDVGESFWETVAGSHAVALLGQQESITISDIIASLEVDRDAQKMSREMCDEVIVKLRDLQEHRRSG